MYVISVTGSKPLPPQFAAFPPGGSLTQAAPPSYEDVVKGLAQAQTVGRYEPTAQTSERLQPPSVILAQPRPAWDESRAVGWQPVVSEPIARPGAVCAGRPAEPRSGQYDQTQPAVNVKGSVEFAIVVFIGSLMCLSPISALLCGVPSVVFAVMVSDSSTHTPQCHASIPHINEATHTMTTCIYLHTALNVMRVILKTLRIIG